MLLERDTLLLTASKTFPLTLVMDNLILFYYFIIKYFA